MLPLCCMHILTHAARQHLSRFQPGRHGAPKVRCSQAGVPCHRRSCLLCGAFDGDDVRLVFDRQSWTRIQLTTFWAYIRSTR